MKEEEEDDDDRNGFRLKPGIAPNAGRRDERPEDCTLVLMT